MTVPTTLVAAPDDIGDWWRLVVHSWHPVSIGSETAAAPYSLFLALGGSPSWPLEGGTRPCGSWRATPPDTRW